MGGRSVSCSLNTGAWLAVVYDMNGREAEEAELILDVLPTLEQYIFCSSAGAAFFVTASCLTSVSIDLYSLKIATFKTV